MRTFIGLPFTCCLIGLDPPNQVLVPLWDQQPHPPWFYVYHAHRKLVYHLHFLTRIEEDHAFPSPQLLAQLPLALAHLQLRLLYRTRRKHVEKRLQTRLEHLARAQTVNLQNASLGGLH